MMVLSINYDLFTPGRDYSSLHAAIKRISGTWAHPTESFWLVRTEKTTTQVRDELKKHLDTNDKLVVAKFGFWASYNLNAEVAKWLNEEVKA